MERRVTARGVIIDANSNIFAVKHRDRTTNGEVSFWAIPGGGIEVGESLHAGLKREYIEEIGIEPKIGRLLFVQQFSYTHRTGEASEKLEFFYHIENAEDYKAPIDLTSTSHGYELARSDFIDPKKNDVLPAFLQTIDLAQFIARNEPVLYFNNLNEKSR